jgi:hypothetical protein
MIIIIIITPFQYAVMQCCFCDDDEQSRSINYLWFFFSFSLVKSKNRTEHQCDLIHTLHLFVYQPHYTITRRRRDSKRWGMRMNGLVLVLWSYYISSKLWFLRALKSGEKTKSQTIGQWIPKELLPKWLVYGIRGLII